MNSFCYLYLVDYGKIITIEPGKRSGKPSIRGTRMSAPPKFIWLRVGNCTVKRTEDLLRSYSAAIHTFNLDDSKSHLMLP